MSYVMHRGGEDQLPRAVHGEGCYVVDSAGKRYLDACGGAAVSCLGHNHPRVQRAIREQAARLCYAHTAFFTNEPLEALAEFLAGTAPAGLNKAYFVSGGSEATEAALKLARQYFVEIGQAQRCELVSRRQSYHGNTLGALAVGGNEARREQFAPLLIRTHHIEPCYAYRHQRDDEDAQAYGRRAADALEAKLVDLGPENVIGFVAETVVGATAGVVPPAPGYFTRIREICDRHGILLILDEVMCGMGRTGALFACEREGVVPDLITIAKGLGAGYEPIGAVLVHERIADAIHKGSGFFQHGHTYIGHALACAAALEVQRTIAEEDLLANVRTRGAEMEAMLRRRFASHPHIGDIRGRGLFWGLELVAEREHKTPFAPELKLHARIKREAMERGLMCYPGGGTADGRRGDHILLAPPFIVQPQELEQLGPLLDAAIEAALAGVRT